MNNVQNVKITKIQLTYEAFMRKLPFESAGKRKTKTQCNQLEKQNIIEENLIEKNINMVKSGLWIKWCTPYSSTHHDSESADSSV